MQGLVLERMDHSDSAANAQTILLVEDEMIIAFDISDRLEDSGFSIDGPHPSVDKALAALEKSRPDGAVLDVQLTDGTVYPVADKLKSMGVPIVFHSGHARSEDLASRYPGASVCTKPCPLGKLEQTLQDILDASS